MLKLYRRPEQRSVAFGEAAILAIVARHGLPSPAVFEAGQYDGRWGLVMARAEGEPLGKLAAADPALILPRSLPWFGCMSRCMPASSPTLRR